MIALPWTALPWTARPRTARSRTALPQIVALVSLASLLVGWSWDLHDVSEFAREHVHSQASEVPALPGDDPALGNPLAWPATLAIGDNLCTLRVQEVNGSTLTWVPTLQAVRPGAGFSLSYVCAPADNWASTRGPHYLWSGEGILVERYWVTADPLRDIVTGAQYYPSGRLFRYYHREDVKDPAWSDPRGPFEWFDEFFAEDGTLIGFAYSKMDARGTVEQASYWMGEMVDYDEFQSLKRDLYARLYP